MDYQKEIKRLSLELMSLKNSVSLIQAEPVLNNLPGSSINTPNLSTKEHSPYWGPFRCEISKDSTKIKIGEGKVFFGNGLTHDYAGESKDISTYAGKKVWIGVECYITPTPTSFLFEDTTVTAKTIITPTEFSGALYIWLARVSVDSYGRAFYLEQRWQGSDIYAPVWYYCGDTDGGDFDCKDGIEETDVHTCKRVCQLASPACNPGNHNHFIEERVYAEIEALKITQIAARKMVTDCWCGQDEDVDPDIGKNGYGQTKIEAGLL